MALASLVLALVVLDASLTFRNLLADARSAMEWRLVGRSRGSTG